MEIQRSHLVGSRPDLARLCNAKNLKIAIEIGTDRGLYAAEFLTIWNGEILYCVDPYEPYPEMPWNRDADMWMAAMRLAPFGPRVRMVRTTSTEFAKTLRQPHFVYIDAAHNYASVLEDVTTWWPLVIPGGLLAGDDFDREHVEVMRAVTAFAEMERLPLQLTTDYNRPPSWFIEKPQ
jgi:hypothetical protein